VSGKTNIEWTDWNWNFLRGCRRVSPGCENCYAETIAGRFSGEGMPYHGLAANGRWTGKIAFHEDILLAPLKRKKPTKYFVNSMSDLFHEDVTDEMLDKAFAVMALCPQHIFQILTKRPERMKAYLSDMQNLEMSDYLEGSPFAPAVSRVMWQLLRLADDSLVRASLKNGSLVEMEPDVVWVNSWPLPNVHLGVSVENQEYADKRIPILLDTPAAVRWISAEPLLGPLNFVVTDKDGWHWDCLEHDKEFQTDRILGPLDWVVVGGESGPRSRPCDIAWIRSIVEQCKSADVPVFVKQIGAVPKMANANEWDWPGSTTLISSGDDGFAASIATLNDRKGGKPDEWPSDLRIREFPGGQQ
jgi:protein gp37